MTVTEIQQTLDQINYLDWEFHISVDAPGHWYLQLRFWAFDRVSGHAAWQSGRKWLLSEHMTRSEIVQTALKAVLTAVEHEAREAFTFKDKPIFGPHMNVDFLADYCDLPWTQDARQEVRDQRSEISEEEAA